MKEIREAAEQMRRDELCGITHDDAVDLLARFALAATPVLEALAEYVDMGGLDGDEDLPEATTLRELLREFRSRK